MAETRTVIRALALLDHIAAADQGVSLSQAARAVDLSPSTAMRLLNTLQGQGYLRRDRTGLFAAGPTLLRVGANALRRDPLYQRAGPHLKVLAQRTGETANLAIRDGWAAVYLRSAPSPQAIRHVSWIGHYVPLADTAVGAALRDEVGPDGYAMVVGTSDPEVAAVAAPVRADDGTVVAALTLTGPTFRFDAEKVHECGQALLDSARALRAELAGERGEDDGLEPSRSG